MLSCFLTATSFDLLSYEFTSIIHFLTFSAFPRMFIRMVADKPHFVVELEGTILVLQVFADRVIDISVMLADATDMHFHMLE